MTRTRFCCVLNFRTIWVVIIIIFRSVTSVRVRLCSFAFTTASATSPLRSITNWILRDAILLNGTVWRWASRAIFFLFKVYLLYAVDVISSSYSISVSTTSWMTPQPGNFLFEMSKSGTIVGRRLRIKGINNQLLPGQLSSDGGRKCLPWLQAERRRLLLADLTNCFSIYLLGTWKLGTFRRSKKCELIVPTERTLSPFRPKRDS